MIISWKNTLIYILFFSIIYKFKCDEYRIPFGLYRDKERCSDYDIMNNIFFNILHVNLSIGTPPQNVPLELNMNSQTFAINSQVYDNKSITYEKLSDYIIDEFKEDEFISSGFNSMDILHLNDKKEKINFVLTTEIKYEYFPFGMLGLAIPTDVESEVYPFFNSLKRADMINSYTWTLKYFDNISLIETLYGNENNNIIGEFIFGDEPHNYERDKSRYDRYQLIKVNPVSSYYFYWEIEFTDIYLLYPDIENNNNSSNRINIKLNGRTKIMPGAGFIFIPKEFNYMIEKRFFDNYYKEKICRGKTINNTIYGYIECDNINSFNVSTFPNICFEHKEFETTFNFTYQDLFLYDKENDKYMFLMINDENLYGWVFGSIFLRKYQLIFNQDSKTIGYYKSMNNYYDNEKDNEKDTEKNKKYMIIIYIIIIYIIIGIFLIVFCFLLITFGMYIQKRYFNKKKKRANELDNSFDYENKEDNMIQKENNDEIN